MEGQAQSGPRTGGGRAPLEEERPRQGSSRGRGRPVERRGPGCRRCPRLSQQTPGADGLLLAEPRLDVCPQCLLAASLGQRLHSAREGLRARCICGSARPLLSAGTTCELSGFFSGSQSLSSPRCTHQGGLRALLLVLDGVSCPQSLQFYRLCPSVTRRP